MIKYIHSIWSLPSIGNNFDNQYDVKFLDKNFYSYLLSMLLVKRLGYKIELYCDKYAYDMYSLIPYDEIHVVDFNSDGVDSKFWIYGKIKTHLLINEPYVHIDGDVFLFRDIIKDNLTNGRYKVAIQSVENENTIGGIFNQLYVESKNPFIQLNSGIKWSKYNFQAYNCGVIGFSDIDFKNIYANKVKEILYAVSNDSNFKSNRDKYEGMFLIAEQSLLYYLIKEHNIIPFEIIPYDEILKHRFDDIHWYDTLPSSIGYCHMLGYSKYREDVINAIKFKIKKFFPNYSHIIDKFDNKYLN